MVTEAVMVLAHGVVMDRETVVASLNEAPPRRTYEISDAQVISAAVESAVLVYTGVVYTGVAYREDDAPAFVGLMSSVYTRVQGKWRLVL